MTLLPKREIILYPIGEKTTCFAEACKPLHPEEKIQEVLLQPPRVSDPKEHGSSVDPLHGGCLFPGRIGASNERSRSRDFPAELVKTFLSTVETVPVLRRHFSTSGVPASWEDWERLPVTNAELYAQLTDIRRAVREPQRLFSPVAPLDLSRPSFPLTVLQSYEDKLCLDERLEHILRLAGCQEFEKLTFVVGKNQRYASSDLAELLIYLNHQCSIVLADGLDQADIGRKLELLGSRIVIWLSPEQPSKITLPDLVSTLITFNKLTNISYTVQHVDVLHIDVVPYFAASKCGSSYSVVPNHFHLETTSEGELLITTLRQDLFPLLRYATGSYVDLRKDSFVLLNSRLSSA